MFRKGQQGGTLIGHACLALMTDVHVFARISLSWVLALTLMPLG